MRACLLACLVLAEAEEECDDAVIRQLALGRRQLREPVQVHVVVRVLICIHVLLCVSA
jgi:hypothetical protein